MELARETGAYTEVIQGEIHESLRRFDRRLDLILMIWVSAHCSRQQVFDIITTAAVALKPGGLFLFDINQDQKIENHNSRIGGRNHSADDIVSVAKGCGLAVRYFRRDGRIFLRCSKKSAC